MTHQKIQYSLVYFLGLILFWKITPFLWKTCPPISLILMWAGVIGIPLFGLLFPAACLMLDKGDLSGPWNLHYSIWLCSLFIAGAVTLTVYTISSYSTINNSDQKFGLVIITIFLDAHALAALMWYVNFLIMVFLEKRKGPTKNNGPLLLSN